MLSPGRHRHGRRRAWLPVRARAALRETTAPLTDGGFNLGGTACAPGAVSAR